MQLKLKTRALEERMNPINQCLIVYEHASFGPFACVSVLKTYFFALFLQNVGIRQSLKRSFWTTLNYIELCISFSHTCYFLAECRESWKGSKSDMDK